ncbi:hypothetical protein OH77DRAFT_1416359 [Trametes cingulata]|nr:hypothetical protein OH77DRAFT_1416359 [Trametes cingulata]
MAAPLGLPLTTPSLRTDGRSGGAQGRRVDGVSAAPLARGHPRRQRRRCFTTCLRCPFPSKARPANVPPTRTGATHHRHASQKHPE